MGDGPIVRLVDLAKSFGKLTVLDGIGLDLHRGQATVIIGASGSGKSVLLKHIAGLLRPDRGEVWFDGQRLDRLSEQELVEARKKLGFLFQMGALFDSMNVEDNIAFPLVEHTRLDLPQRRERVREVLAMVGLDGTQPKMPIELSGGQRKRVALARAIVLQPALVLYDEPTTGLDPIRADVINELIVTLQRQLGITSLVVTHDMASAHKIADRIVMLHGGKIIADGNPKAIENSDQELVRRFVRGEADREDLELIRAGFQQAPRGRQPAPPESTP